MASARDIITRMDAPTTADVALISKAYKFAEEAHKDHKRNSGEPYFIHLLETAKTLAELGMGPKTIAAGLLHDVIEDVDVTPETLEREFNTDILRLVEGVTKLGTIRYQGTTRHIESLRKLFVATSEDIRVIIIKLADRLHNMRTLKHVPERKRKRIAIETLEVYAPIADRLSMGKIQGELEDLAFPYIYPEEYEKVSALLKQKSKETLPHLEKVNKSLKKELAKQGITNFTTEYRLKRLYSLFRKLERKQWDIEKIHDISALRIIVPTVSDCYKILGVIHSNWRPLPGKIKDYIAFEKPNGYQSLQTTIFTGDGGIVEIQIRTPEMHHEAEYGIASHILYKEALKDSSTFGGSKNLLWIKSLLPKLGPLPNLPYIHKQKETVIEPGANYVTPSAPKWVKEIAETHQNASGSGEFMDTLKTDFFTYRVFVFTPKGDVIDLPVDSSPIDFAYAIHSDIGDRMSGAKVNRKMTSLDTKLKNGDIVEIVTKPEGKPNQKWLEYTKTSLARRHIRAALAREKETAT